METFTLNRLSEMLEIDRTTMQRALRNVPPDLVTGKRQSFKVATAAKALERHRRNVGTSTPGNSSNQHRLALIDEEEAVFATLDKQFERLEAEPSIAKRREMSLKMQIGKTINRLEELFAETNGMDEMGSILAIATEKMIGTARSRLLDRLDLWDEVDEMSSQIRTEQEAAYRKAKRAKESTLA